MTGATSTYVQVRSEASSGRDCSQLGDRPRGWRGAARPGQRCRRQVVGCIDAWSAQVTMKGDLTGGLETGE